MHTPHRWDDMASPLAAIARCSARAAVQGPALESLFAPGGGGYTNDLLSPAQLQRDGIFDPGAAKTALLLGPELAPVFCASRALAWWLCRQTWRKT